MESNINSDVKLYLINSRQVIKMPNSNLDKLILITNSISFPTIIEIDSKLLLNNLLDNLILKSEINSHFTYDYKKIQDFKDDAFYQFSPYFACLTISVIRDYKNVNSLKFINDTINFQFYFIKNIMIVYSTELENENYMEKTFLEKLNFHIYRGAIENIINIEKPFLSEGRKKWKSKQFSTSTKNITGLLKLYPQSPIPK